LALAKTAMHMPSMRTSDGTRSIPTAETTLPPTPKGHCCCQRCGIMWTCGCHLSSTAAVLLQYCMYPMGVTPPRARPHPRLVDNSGCSCLTCCSSARCTSAPASDKAGRSRALGESEGRKGRHAAAAHTCAGNFRVPGMHQHQHGPQLGGCQLLHGLRPRQAGTSREL
jgi:hypothetical protein